MKNLTPNKTIQQIWKEVDNIFENEKLSAEDKNRILLLYLAKSNKNTEKGSTLKQTIDPSFDHLIFRL